MTATPGLDESCFGLKANLGLGTILQKSYLDKQVKEALEIPATRNLKQRLNFCIWTQQSRRSGSISTPEAWRPRARGKTEETAA